MSSITIIGDARAKADVTAFIESLGLRPMDVGGLKMARWLEGMGVVTVGLAASGVGYWDFALGVEEFTGRAPDSSSSIQAREGRTHP
ncbi:hypothetical protein ACIO14_21010 [Nocardia fluminea]|uniref:hypothetical protein n=1 Tax=Nocardia fluminea TaxID=134984 RepID=UPI003816BE2C